MNKFSNTIDVVGDKVFADSLFSKTLTEYEDCCVETIGCYIFAECTGLSKVNVPNVKFIGDFAFRNCAALSDFNAPSLRVAEQRSFYNCSNLVNLKFDLMGYIGKYAFQGCSALKRIEFKDSVSYIDIGAFYGCSALTTVIFRSPNYQSYAGTNIFDGTPIASGNGYIYVPSALVNSFKNANGWTTYSSKIRAIEDYPDICGE